MTKPVPPEAQVHMAHFIVSLAISHVPDAVSRAEAENWLEILHEYAKTGALMRLFLAGEVEKNGNQADH